MIMVGFRLAPIPFALCILALAGCTPAQPTRYCDGEEPAESKVVRLAGRAG
jgi:hypothetical protein